MIKLVFYAALMQAGSQRARRVVEVIKASRAVRVEWRRYGWAPTDANVKRFLAEAYGIVNLDPDRDPAQRFTKAQLDQIFEGVARILVGGSAAGEAGFLVRLGEGAPSLRSGVFGGDHRM